MIPLTVSDTRLHALLAWFRQHGGRHSRRARRWWRRLRAQPPRDEWTAAKFYAARVCVPSRAERAATRRLRWAARRFPRVKAQVLRSAEATRLVLAGLDHPAGLDWNLFRRAAGRAVQQCHLRGAYADYTRIRWALALVRGWHMPAAYPGAVDVVTAVQYSSSLPLWMLVP